MKEVKFNGYTIKEDGTILNKKGNPLSPWLSGSGYPQVGLWYGGTRHRHYVHRLVAEHFVDGRDETVNHKDGDKHNNHASNLEWMSQSDNNKHAREFGLNDGMYEKKLPHFTRRKIAGMYKTGRYTQQTLCNMFGVTEGTLRRYINEFKEGKDRL